MQHTVGQNSTAQLPNSTAVVFCCFGSCLGSCLFLVRQLSFAGSAVDSAVVFCLFGSCFSLVWQLFFDILAVVWFWAVGFYCLGSCVLLVRQLFFAASAVVLFFTMHTVGQNSTAQLPNSPAVVFCCFGSCLGSCLFLVRQLFFAASAVVFF